MVNGPSSRWYLNFTASTEVFNPLTDTWAATDEMKTGVAAFKMVVI